MSEPNPERPDRPGRHTLNLIRQRRFEDLPASVPERVKGLGETHPAILEKRTQFPTMVAAAPERQRVLISGNNSRKIGQIVTKGALKGYAIYTLTLPERTTCPEHCAQWQTCYGNAMPFAWRIKPGPELEAAIIAEIPKLLAKHPIGVLVRLHVLGDFYAPEYVGLWFSLLAKYPRLATYGYTANNFSGDERSQAIAAAIASTKEKFGRRFAIRWSQPTSGEDTATVVGYQVAAPRVTSGLQQGIVCPSEREATACCATCGLCWEEAAKKESIVFVKHGMGSRRSEAIANRAGEVNADGHRKVRPLTHLAKIAGPVANSAPQMIWIDPTELIVDESYQRTITANGMRLISKILKGFDWARFKAVDVEEPVLTPTGWRKHGDLQPGDHVFGPDGKPVRVIAKTPVYSDADCFRVFFCDGYSVVVSGDHLWTVEDPYRAGAGNETRTRSRSITLTTRDMKVRVEHQKKLTDGRFLRVPVAEAVQLPTRHLPVDPYVLGVWLGDGGLREARITSGALDVEEMAANLAAAGVAVKVTEQRSHFRISIGGGRKGDRMSSELTNAMRGIGVYSRKHIPDDYLLAAEHQRFALLQGLMDTDGSCSESRAVFCAANESLAISVHELVMSLGMRSNIARRTGIYRGQPRAFWQVQFFASHVAPPFRLTRKASAARPSSGDVFRFRRILSVEPVSTRPVSCIQVDREDGLYLVGRHLVTTHNCPIVCRTVDNELFVLDGQHTAIAAASHPEIPMIPVMLVEAAELKDRARAFLGHNRDRIAVTQGQIHNSAIQAGDPEAVEIKRVCDAAGVRIVATPPPEYRVGDTMALGVIRTLIRKSGAAHVTDVLSILVRAKLAPIKADHIKAVNLIIAETDIAHRAIVDFLRSSDPDKILLEAKSISISNGEPIYDALAGILISNARPHAELAPAAE